MAIFARSIKLRKNRLGMRRKVLSTADAVAFVEHQRHAGKEVVFTNGVFDLLHPGHIRYLQDARREGDALDRRGQLRSIGAGHKGPDAADQSRSRTRRGGRGARVRRRRRGVRRRRSPPNHQPTAARRAGQRCGLGPDAIIGRDIVEARGGRVVRIPIAEGYSTTAIIERSIQSGLTVWQSNAHGKYQMRHAQACRCRPPRLAQPSGAAEDRRCADGDGFVCRRMCAGCRPLLRHSTLPCKR